MLINDPFYMDKMKIKKNPPTNENITLFKYMDVSMYGCKSFSDFSP